MHKLEIDKQAWTAAAPSDVYALLADGATWPTWSGIGSFELEQPGDHGGESLNAIRAFRTGRTTSRSGSSSSCPAGGSATPCSPACR